MNILWRTNVFNYKKIVKEASDYWHNMPTSNTKNKKKVYSSYSCEEYSFFISRYSISIWANNDILTDTQKEIEDVLKIIFRNKKITGFIDNIKDDNAWILNVLPSIPNIHKVSTSISPHWSNSQIEACKIWIDGLEVSEDDKGNKECVLSILNTFLVNNAVGTVANK